MQKIGNGKQQCLIKSNADTYKILAEMSDDINVHTWKISVAESYKIQCRNSVRFLGLCFEIHMALEKP